MTQNQRTINLHPGIAEDFRQMRDFFGRRFGLNPNRYSYGATLAVLMHVWNLMAEDKHLPEPEIIRKWLEAFPRTGSRQSKLPLLTRTDALLTEDN